MKMSVFVMVLGALSAFGDADVTATFGGKNLAVEECRVSAVPMTRTWSGTERPLSQTKKAWFVSFDVTAPGEFALTLPAAAKEVRVHPFHRTDGKVAQGVFRTRLEHPEQFVVEAGGTEIHVFADAPWRYEPRKGDRYFGPGVHEQGAIAPKSGERIVLDRGATVYGQLVLAGVTNVTVEGRGILDSSRLARSDTSFPVYAKKCGELTVSGIILRDAPRSTVNICDSSDILIDGIRIVGDWRCDSGGIDICACERTVVRNSFIRSFDDCVVARPRLRVEESTPMRDMAVSNCVLCCDRGVAMKVEHGRLPAMIADIRFRDIDCLRPAASVARVTTRRGSSASVIGGISFDDIRIDGTGPNVNLVDVGAEKLDSGFVRLDYLDLAFRDFKVYDRPGHLAGKDSPIRLQVSVRAELPRFQVRDLVLGNLPETTLVSLVGNVNRLEPLLADPSLVRDGNRYLMVGTENRVDGGKPFKGEAVFPLFESTDLKTWRPAKTAYPGGRLLARADAFGKDGFWAPQLFKYRDRWYFAYTSDCQWGIAAADRPEGPFKPHVVFPKENGQIDPHVFFDDDGRIYASFADWARGGISVVELSADLKSFRGDPVPAVRNDRPWESVPCERHYANLNARRGYRDWTAFGSNNVTAEGPTLMKRGGKYVLLYSANDFRSPYYCVCAAVAEKPTGPWRKVQREPILWLRDTLLGGTGHGDAFLDSDGALRYVFHYHNSPVTIGPRRTGIARLVETFDANGDPHYATDRDSVVSSLGVIETGLGEGGGK